MKSTLEFWTTATTQYIPDLSFLVIAMQNLSDLEAHQKIYRNSLEQNKKPVYLKLDQSLFCKAYGREIRKTWGTIEVLTKMLPVCKM